MANQKNTFIDTITDKRCIPYNSTKTGTIQTVGKEVVGTGTLFLTQCKVGDWLVDLTQNEIHKIISVSDNFSMHIQEAFAVDLPALTAVVTVPRFPQAKEISVLIPFGSPNGLIDGKTLYAGVPYDTSKLSRSKSTGYDFVDPIIIDASGTTAGIIINY